MSLGAECRNVASKTLL